LETSRKWFYVVEPSSPAIFPPDKRSTPEIEQRKTLEISNLPITPLKFRPFRRTMPVSVLNGA
jgi:hypothetical protein